MNMIGLSLSRWFFPRPHTTAILLGNDSTGKTTLLYQLKTGKTIVTIPTIGFNVETIERGNRGDFTLWDVGGCDQMRPLIRHYLRPDRPILFLHDCADSDRLEDSISQFHSTINMMFGAGTTHIWILLTKQDMVPLPEQETTVSGIRARFESEIVRYNGTPKQHMTITIIDHPGMNALDNDMVHRVLDEMKAALDRAGASLDEASSLGAATAKTSTKAPHQQPTAEDLLQRVKMASIDEPNAEDFWQAFLDGSLGAWDHYAHLRSGYFVMLEALASGIGNGNGILGCADVFLGHLARLRAGNPERFRNTAHRTMTVFWLAQIQLAVIDFENAEEVSKIPGREDFQDIVLHAPSLMDSSLWKLYYSKSVMFSPEARENWCHPDLQALPAFATSTTSLQQQQQQQQISPLLVLENDTDRHLRFALIVVQTSLNLKVRRGALVKRALQALEVSTIRLRAQNNHIQPYSETQSYFWIQIVHACLRALDMDTELVASDASHSPGYEPSLAGSLHLPELKSLFNLTGEEWREYYKEKTWNSITARQEFTLPDLKPLPSVIHIPSHRNNASVREKKVFYGNKNTLAGSSEELLKNQEIATLVATAMSTDPGLASHASTQISPTGGQHFELQHPQPRP